jgi:hypothetical protein
MTIRSFIAGIRDQEPGMEAGLSSQEAYRQSPAYELLGSGRRKYILIFVACMILGDIAIGTWVALHASHAGIKG